MRSKFFQLRIRKLNLLKVLSQEMCGGGGEASLYLRESNRKLDSMVAMVELDEDVCANGQCFNEELDSILLIAKKWCRLPEACQITRI